jgi:hypothetical protein
MDIRKILAVLAFALAGYSLFRSFKRLRRTFAES